MKYHISTDTPSYLCDRTDHLHPWAAIRLCQEVTEYHGNATGIGFQTLKAQNRAWVLTRALYFVERRPRAFEKVDLSTWSRGNDGLFAYRDYLMTTPEGEKLLTGTSYWAIIDYERRRVLRLSDSMNAYPYENELATPYTALNKIVVPDMGDDDVKLKLQARFSMLDHTAHVNNSEYVKWIFDCLFEAGFDIDRPFCLEIDYHHETRLGDPVAVKCKQLGDAWFATVSNPAGVGVVARVSHVEK